MNYRYVVNISFRLTNDNGSFKKVEPIAEPTKTLAEARLLKVLIDKTVKEAFVFDKATQKIAERWK